MSNEHGTEFNISGDYQHQGDQVQGDKHINYGERSVHVENSTVESINTGVQIHITPIIPPKNDPEYATWQRDKQNFIAAVRQAWIDGFLKKAIYHEVYHVLGVEKIPTKETRLWNLDLIPKNEPIPAGKPILDIFQENGRSLLILGEPASGKTITLLQLAEGLLNLAEKEEFAPLPIIFNLSSWVAFKDNQEKKAQQKPREIAEITLKNWMAEEGVVQYGAARPLTEEWIAKQRFIYLLDGLDEVAKTERKNCLEEINKFVAQHPSELVVCCRRKDYEEIQAKLNTRSAVYIQPLTPEQTEGYLQRFGEQTAGVRQMLREDEELRELAKYPLLLSVMVVAYEGRVAQELEIGREAKLNHLFRHYVARMFRHRKLPEGITYTQEQALHWVMNLAYGLYKTNQSVFYIEYLQPEWLGNRLIKRFYGFPLGVVAFSFVALIVEILSLCIYILIQNGEISKNDIVQTLPLSIISGLYGMVLFSQCKNVIELYEEPQLKPFSWAGLRNGALQVVIFSVVILVLVPLMCGLPTGLMQGWEVGSSITLGYGLVFMIIGASKVILDIFIGFSRVNIHETPNQGIKLTLRNAFIFTLAFGSIGALILGFVMGCLFALAEGDIFRGVIFGLFIGFIGSISLGWISYGGSDFFSHYNLRFILFYYNFLPYPYSDPKLTAFLDAMAERLLLRRVGGGWVFIHRYLLEYFAAQHPDFVPREDETKNSPNQ